MCSSTIGPINGLGLATVLVGHLRHLLEKIILPSASAGI